jgi:queuosine precursor transporter
MTIVTLPPAPGWENQQAFETVFGFLPRLVVASLIAYWCGEFANSFVMAKMKIITKGKMLWARTIGSTAVGQLVDTVIVMIIGFGGTMSWDLIFSLIWSGYVVKVLYEAAATPVTYLVVNALKKAEGVDLYDTDTDFNPFARMS